MALEFLLLGNVEARLHGTLLDLGPARQRCVLVALLVDANRLVAPDRLVDRVWGDRVPLRARETLRSYIFRLRKALARADGVELAHRSGGYELQVDPMAVDLHRFTALLAQARSRTGDEQVRAVLASALDLWRGEPFADLDTPWLDGLRRSLTAERFSAQLDHDDIRLRQGDHGTLVAELTNRIAAHPLDERLAGQLMLALYRTGRPTEALDRYRLLSAQLDEVGVRPSPALRELHQRILTTDPALACPATARPSAPRQLPAPPRPFTARVDELAALDKAFAGDATVTVLAGPGGIGKTWLALHWAHRAANRFPDGQLYVNLRGFDPSGTPTPPTVVLRGFLDALGASRVPVDLDAQAGLYRSMTAGKRLLVVLDNARDTEQVLPLLPGAATCAVLVTSRRRLTGLVTTHGAGLLPVDVVGDDDARELLACHLGHERLAAEPEAVAELVTACGGLPLAIGIVAARGAGYPRLPLRSLADDLATARLAALDAGEPSANLSAVFASSHRALDAGTAAVFELLAAAPGPDIGLPAVTALTDPHAGQVRALEDAHLVGQPTPGRYRMHDLVRLYATAHGRPPDAPLRRLVDHYLHTAYAGELLLEPRRFAITLDPADCLPEPLPDEAAALAWFDREHANLLAAQRFAADRGWRRPAWQLAWTLLTFHARRGLLHDRLTVWRLALSVTDDPADRALAHRYLGYACAEAGLAEEAVAQLGQALALADDASARAGIHHALARAWEQQGDLARALRQAEDARRCYREAGDDTGHARVLAGIGWLLAQLGRHADATEHCESALTLLRRQGKKDGEAACLDTLGYVANLAGNHTEAVAHYREALTLYEQVGDDYFTADTLDHLGQAHAALGASREAREAWRRASRLYREQLRDTDVQRVERLLADLP